MSGERAVRGTWVEIHTIVLAPGERAPSIPQETRAVPLELRVRGFLVDDGALLGDEVAVRTRAGRLLEGRLAAIEPHYDHGFGAPVAELLQIGEEARALLEGVSRGRT